MNEKYKVYTKTGDKGKTSLSGGTRVPKYHPRIDAYGILDELNSFIGLLRDSIDNTKINDFLIEVQNRVFDIESNLAAETEKAQARAPKILPDNIKNLEEEIDKMDSQLESLKNFILPGGHTIVSYCHICRTICRRSERAILKIEDKNINSGDCIRYINRLSDYFFVLSRFFAQSLNCKTAIWTPNKQK